MATLGGFHPSSSSSSSPPNKGSHIPVKQTRQGTDDDERGIWLRDAICTHFTSWVGHPTTRAHTRRTSRSQTTYDDPFCVSGVCVSLVPVSSHIILRPKKGFVQIEHTRRRRHSVGAPNNYCQDVVRRVLCRVNGRVRVEY